MNRYADFALKFFIRRPFPHGIFSWRYLCLRPPRLIAFHRRLWLAAKPAAMPLGLFLVIELFLWLKWVSFSAWKSCFRLMGRMAEPGLFSRFLALSLVHALPPSDILAFGLHDKHPSKPIWDYVYLSEWPACHHVRQLAQGFPTDPGSLQDKQKVTETLAALGIPTVPNLAIIPRNRPEALDSFQREGRFFLKTRSGSGSRDAFVLDVANGEKKIHSVKNGMVSGAASFNEFQDASARSDYLVQAFTANHPFVARLCDTGDAVTLRVITENRGEGRVRLYSATLEIPNVSGRMKFSHAMLPIDLDSGEIRPFPGKSLPDDTKRHLESVYTRARGRVLPDWDQIKESALRAHLAYPGLFSVAWDFVLTPDGPMILEGNTGWDTRVPQMIHGGLLGDLIEQEDL